MKSEHLARSMGTGVESDAENRSPSGFLFLRFVNSALLRVVKSSPGGKGPEDGVMPCSPFPFPPGPLNGWQARDLMDSAR